MMENSEILFKKATVLIVSESYEEARLLAKRGFKRVDYFKSEICAWEYFRRQKRRLESYDLVIVGSLVTNNYGYTRLFEFSRRIDGLFSQGKIRSYIHWNSISKSWTADNEADRVTTVAFEHALNYIISSLKSDKRFIYKLETRYRPYFAINEGHRLVGTTVEQSKLKILFCHSGNLKSSVSKICKILGLDVTFIREDARSNELILPHLGDYDIIIGSEQYSSFLNDALIESQAQCSRTGRGLSLIITYENSVCWSVLEKEIEYSLGRADVSLKSIRSGAVDPQSLEMKKTDFRVPVITYRDSSLEERYKEYEEKVIQVILNVSLWLYSYELIRLYGTRLIGGDSARNANYYDLFYERTLRQMQEDISKKAEPLNVIKDIERMVKAYCEHQQMSSVLDRQRDIRISESREGYRVDILDKGRFTKYSLTLSKNYQADSYRIVAIRKADMKKHRLGEERYILVSLGLSADSQTMVERASENDIVVIKLIRQMLVERIMPVISSSEGKLDTAVAKRHVIQPK